MPESLDPEPFQLCLKCVGHILRAVLVADLQTLRCALLVAAKASSHSLADRLKRLESVCPLRGMDAHPFTSTVIDRDKDGDLTVLYRLSAREVGSPHLVRRIGRDFDDPSNMPGQFLVRILRIRTTLGGTSLG